MFATTSLSGSFSWLLVGKNEGKIAKQKTKPYLLFFTSECWGSWFNERLLFYLQGFGSTALSLPAMTSKRSDNCNNDSSRSLVGMGDQTTPVAGKTHRVLISL